MLDGGLQTLRSSAGCVADGDCKRPWSRISTWTGLCPPLAYLVLLSTMAQPTFRCQAGRGSGAGMEGMSRLPGVRGAPDRSQRPRFLQRPPVGDPQGNVDPRPRHLVGQAAARPRVGEGGSQVQLRIEGRQTSYGVVGVCPLHLVFQGQVRRTGGPRRQPAGLAQPRLVGHGRQKRPGQRPARQTAGRIEEPPETLGEGGPVGRGTLPHDCDGIMGVDIRKAIGEKQKKPHKRENGK